MAVHLKRYNPMESAERNHPRAVISNIATIMLKGTFSLLSCKALSAPKSVLGRAAVVRATCLGLTSRGFASGPVLAERSTAVFNWGMGTQGQLGHEKIALVKAGFLGTENYFQDAPRRLVRSKQYTELSCGNSYTLGLTDTGEVHGWGKGFSGDDSESLVPVAIDMSAARDRDRKIVKVVAGPRHCAAIDNQGSVLTWGDNGGWYEGGGQLGHGDTQAVAVPTYVKALDEHGVRCADVSLGDQHSVFRTEDGEVLTCGDGSFGRLGTGDTANVETPMVVTELMDHTITQVAAGHSHTLALSSSGKVFSWGKNDKGQVGENDAFDVNSMEPYPLQIDMAVDGKETSDKPVFVSAGHKRSAVVTSEGNCYVWGWDLNHIPTIVDRSLLGNMRIKKAFCGGEKHRCLALLLEDGSLWTTGNAGNHMLGWAGASGLQRDFHKIGQGAWDNRELRGIYTGRFHMAVIADMV